MNARGSTEVIIATIGLSMGVLSQNLFSMIVTMAIVTTMAMPPMPRPAIRPVTFTPRLSRIRIVASAKTAKLTSSRMIPIAEPSEL